MFHALFRQRREEIKELRHAVLRLVGTSDGNKSIDNTTSQEINKLDADRGYTCLGAGVRQGLRVCES